MLILSTKNLRPIAKKKFGQWPIPFYIILLTSSNNQISEFRIPNIYNEIFVLIFLMILRTHFEASLRFRKN